MTGGMIRLGNFFNSEIYGKVTDVPWAIIFAKTDPSALPRHPTQLYEALGYLIISLILYFVYRKYKRQPHPGLLLGLCFIMGWSYRFVMEFFKENQVHFENSMTFNMGQLLSIPFILIGVVLAFYMKKKVQKSPNTKIKSAKEPTF